MRPTGASGTDTGFAGSNRGARSRQLHRPAAFPVADGAIRAEAGCDAQRLDVLLVNPPAPDGAIWI
ncbi:MAG: hypothetical protein V1772_14285, partial [Chloroflexota bacterium]